MTTGTRSSTIPKWTRYAASTSASEPSVRTTRSPPSGVCVISLVPLSVTRPVVVGIEQVIDRVNSPWLRALPDFGNSLAAHDEDFAYRAIEAMFSHAYGICHVKDGEVTEDGKAVRVDLARTFAILKKSGYKGYCSIEYDARGDPYKTTADLVEQTVKLLS